MSFKNFSEIEEYVQKTGVIKKIVLAGSHDDIALNALIDAKNKGIADAILIGKRDETARILSERGEDLADYSFIEIDDDKEMAAKAIEMVRNKEADIPMKGLMHTSVFMKAILNKETGLKEPGDLLSQASLIECEKGLIIVSDCAVNIEPNIDEKVAIVKNCLSLSKVIGIEDPKVAMLSAVEVVNPKIKSTVEAVEVKERLKDIVKIDGPLALDNAISKEAAKHKGIESDVAGEANILVVPDLPSGNIFTKGLVFFGHLKMAGTLNGLKAPVIMTSRTDTEENKYLSILTSVLMSLKSE